VSRAYLGVDGGKSSTIALIGDEQGRVIGYGRAGPSNHIEEVEHGRIQFVRAIQDCVSEACMQAGLNFDTARFRAACLGFSGGPVDKEPILREILRCEQMTVTHDALIALAGATCGEPGLIVIAGTGSIAFGRNAVGRTARAGGWGYIFGDEGSGFDIARASLRAALRFEEGWGPPTVLHQVLLAESGAKDANEALHRFYTADFPRPRIASFAKAIDRAASNGDAVAIQILENAGQQLAMFAAAVRNQLFAAGEPACVSYIGGVFRSTRVLERFRMLSELEKSNRVGAPVYGPAAGALIEAYRTAHADVSLSGVPEVEKQ
jgi:N-acetylglucosamine kinase-like BadF-type ATPase